MVNSFEKLQSDVLARCKEAADLCGVAVENVQPAGKALVAPCIQVAVYPTDESSAQRSPVWFDANVDVLCFAKGSVSNQEAVNNAMNIAWAVLRYVNGSPGLLTVKNPSVLNFINENGTMAFSDKCCVVLSWNAKYQVGG